MNTNNGRKSTKTQNSGAKPKAGASRSAKSAPKAGARPAAKSSASSGSKPSGNRTAGKTTRTGRPIESATLSRKAQKSRTFFSDKKESQKKGDPLPKFNDDAVRLNKFLSNAGICSRREADMLIQTGVISVNGEIVLELGYKIGPTDSVQYDGQTVRGETKRYVLLNKPKGFITANDDPFGRKTVMGLVRKACRERIYPIDRMDKETTGLLLFTNDGDLAKKLTHPRQKTSKIYDVELNKNFNADDREKMLNGVELEDGTARFDAVEFVKGSPKNIGLEIHSGKNQIVRRTLERLGYIVVKLDRVSYAGLTKKDLPRGEYRHLTEKEVAFLKMS